MIHSSSSLTEFTAFSLKFVTYVMNYLLGILRRTKPNTSETAIKSGWFQTKPINLDSWSYFEHINDFMDLDYGRRISVVWLCKRKTRVQIIISLLISFFLCLESYYPYAVSIK